MPNDVQSTLDERGSRYGDFSDHAAVAQELQDVMRGKHRYVDGERPGWRRLSYVQRQALTVIADKIARVLTGDPDYADNWHDIQGYARLVEERLPDPETKQPETKQPETELPDAVLRPGYCPHGMRNEFATKDPA